MDTRVSVITSCFQGRSYLAGFFENLSQQTAFPEIEVILVHNAPGQEELQIVAEFGKRYPSQLQHIIVDPVETIGASWNRAWKAARSSYTVIWNVDDRRPPYSIEHQVETFERSPGSVMVYGDYIEVEKYGVEIGRQRITPEFSRKTFSRIFPISGAFFMWRKEIAALVGYFDEQLKVAADFDFSLRVALNDFKMQRAKHFLGYFTNAGEGLSSSGGARLTAIETTMLQLRYAIYDKVRPDYLDEARKYNISNIQSFNAWRLIDDYIPGYAQYVKQREYLWKLGRVRNFLRNLFLRLGILGLIYKFQERFIRREI
jgi:hypothetical protein